MTRRTEAPPAAAALIAVVLFSLLHCKGTAITPDGWAYWQGAVSLISRRGYAYFSGHPITAWPPLYSLYLAGWMVLVGPTGLSLILANAVLICTQAWLWCWTLLSIWRNAEQTTPALAVAAVAVYLGVSIPLFEQAVLADVLKYSLLPLLLKAGWHARTSTLPREIIRWTMLSALIGTLLLLVHNNSIAFVVANCFVILLASGERWRRAAAGGIAGLLPIFIWLVARHELGQDLSHAFGLGVANYGPRTYLVQGLRGVGRLLMPGYSRAPILIIVCAALFIASVRQRQRTGPLMSCGLFVGISAAVTYVLFNLTRVNDPLSEARFVLFVPLTMVPLLLLATARWKISVFVACVVLFLSAPLYWSAISVHSISISSPEELGFPGDFVTPRSRVSPDYRQGPPVQVGDAVVVAPNDKEERANKVR